MAIAGDTLVVAAGGPLITKQAPPTSLANELIVFRLRGDAAVEAMATP